MGGHLATLTTVGSGIILEETDTHAMLKSLIGCISVNFGDGEHSSFERANEDAEVDRLCLLLFWHSSSREALSRLIAPASDLVFLYPRLGSRSFRRTLFMKKESCGAIALSGGRTQI